MVMVVVEKAMHSKSVERLDWIRELLQEGVQGLTTNKASD
jgi:hypothetical protein